MGDSDCRDYWNKCHDSTCYEPTFIHGNTQGVWPSLVYYCPDGYSRITKKEECTSVVATALGKSLGVDQAVDAFPHGCYSGVNPMCLDVVIALQVRTCMVTTVLKPVRMGSCKTKTRTVVSHRDSVLHTLLAAALAIVLSWMRHVRSPRRVNLTLLRTTLPLNSPQRWRLRHPRHWSY